MSPKLAFNQVPFFYIFLITFVGIVCQPFVINYQIYLLLFCILIIAIEINFRFLTNAFISTITFTVLFFTLGTFSKSIYDQTRHNSNILADETYELCLLIQDIQSTKSGICKGIASIESVNGNENVLNEEILFYSNNEISLNHGDIIQTKAKLNTFKNKGNPGEFNAMSYWQSKGIHFYTFLNETNTLKTNENQLNILEELILTVKNNCSELLENSLKEKDLSIAKALLLGDKSRLDNQTKETFANTGAMHLLAVSGLHIGIILMILTQCFTFLSSKISRKSAIIISISFLWFYACITGCSPSIVRAVFMFSCIALAQLTGKKYIPINILFFTAFVLLIINPNVWMDIGFQLSYLAMFGIYLFYAPIEGWFHFKSKPIQFLWQGMAVGFSAQLMTFPLVLYHFHQFPNYFVLSNLILICISGILLTSGILMLTFSKLTFFGNLFIKLFIGILFVLILSLETISEFPLSLAQGFQFSFWMLPLMITVMLFLSQIKFFTHKWFVFLGFFILAFIQISHIRFTHLNSNHILFFNEKSLSFVVKKGDKILAFVQSDKDNSHINNTLDNYSKIYPGELTIIKMDSINGKVFFNNDTISWEKKKSKYLICHNNQKFNIHFSSFNDSNDSVMNIYMPWIEHDKSLKNGSMLFRLD